MRTQETDRGFPFISFIDRYDTECVLMKSSLAFEDCIWFGIRKTEPMIMAKDAFKYGIETNKTTGWLPYKIPKEVSISTKMHLTREQVKEILPHLIKFVETGEI